MKVKKKFSWCFPGFIWTVDLTDGCSHDNWSWWALLISSQKNYKKQANTPVRQYLLCRRKHWGTFQKCCTTMRPNLCLRPCLFVFFFLSLTLWCESEKCGGSCWARWGEPNEKEWHLSYRRHAPTPLPLQYLAHLSSQWQTSNRRRGNKGARTTAGRLREGRVAILHTYPDRFLI